MTLISFVSVSFSQFSQNQTQESANNNNTYGRALGLASLHSLSSAAALVFEWQRKNEINADGD